MFNESYMESECIFANENQPHLKCKVGVNTQCSQQKSKQPQEQLAKQQHSQQQQQRRTLDTLSLFVQILQNPQKYQSYANGNNLQYQTTPKIIIQQPNQDENNQSIVANVQNKDLVVQNETIKARNSHKSFSTLSVKSSNNITKQLKKKHIKPQLPQINNNNAQYGISMYEQVLTKNFQIINSLLNKLNQLYSHNESYEKIIAEMNQKMHKLQVDNENIHHQFRTSHFAIDKKLNSITNQYSNMLQDLNFLKKIWNQSQGIDQTLFFQKVFSNHQRQNPERNVKRRWTRREKKKSQQSKLLINQPNIYKHKHNQQSKTYPPQFIPIQPSNPNPSYHKLPSSRRSSAYHKKSIHLVRKRKNLLNLKGLNERNLSKALLEQISESNIRSQCLKQQQIREEDFISHNSEQSSSNDSSISIQNDSEMEQLRVVNNNIQPTQNQSINLKKRPNTYNGLSSSIQYNHQKQLQNHITIQMEKSSKYDQQMEKFTQLISGKCKQVEEKVELKIVELKKEMCKQLIDRELKPQLISTMQLMLDSELQSLRTHLLSHTSSLQSILTSQLSTKCSRQQVRQDLKQILQSMSSKVNTLMDDCYRKFANRSQSKRAILFLERKINKLVETAWKFNGEKDSGDGERVKCLSCNKGFFGNGGDGVGGLAAKMQCQAPQQPILGQVHLLQKPTQQQQHQPDLTLIPKLRDLSKFNSVSEIFETNDEKEQQHDGIRQSVVQKGKFKKASQTTLSGNANSNPKLKYLNHITENRPTTSCSIGFINTEFNQKSWKEKATNLLRKDHSAVNWRSKSQYKK